MFAHLNFMEEIWKSVPGFENDYEVSNLGNVKSMTNYRRWKPNRLKALRLDRNGYVEVGLYKRCKNFHKKVHRLVALAFIPNPENKPQVNHKDFNRTNNRLENLEWCTALENCVHAINGGRRKASLGEDCSGVVLTDSQVLEIFNKTDVTQCVIAKLYGVAQGTIAAIKVGKTWSHVTGKRYIRKRPLFKVITRWEREK